MQDAGLAIGIAVFAPFLFVIGFIVLDCIFGFTQE
jgi:hypothetical protein